MTQRDATQRDAIQRDDLGISSRSRTGSRRGKPKIVVIMSGGKGEAA